MYHMPRVLRGIHFEGNISLLIYTTMGTQPIKDFQVYDKRYENWPSSPTIVFLNIPLLKIAHSKCAYSTTVVNLVRIWCLWRRDFKRQCRR